MYKNLKRKIKRNRVVIFFFFLWANQVVIFILSKFYFQYSFIYLVFFFQNQTNCNLKKNTCPRRLVHIVYRFFYHYQETKSSYHILISNKDERFLNFFYNLPFPSFIVIIGWICMPWCLYLPQLLSLQLLTSNQISENTHHPLFH
jgi:hypothetical protein